LAVARWTRGSACPGRSSAGDQASVPDANTHAPDGARRHQETSLYRAPSGAWVFASGTLAWSPALDRPGHADPRVQRATANLLDRIRKRD
jgi:hypothetical protein